MAEPRATREASAALVLAREYEQRLIEHGDSALGAHWPNEADRQIRYRVMLEIIQRLPTERVSLLDLGCGTGGLLAYLRDAGLPGIDYRGLDASELALGLARRKFPDAAFEHLDIGDPEAEDTRLACDYLVANGLFTARFGNSYQTQWQLMERTIRSAWPHVRRGLALNVMSKVVDWERDDLFHVPMDDLARLLHDLAGRHVLMRADYGLYEYTAYAYRSASSLEGRPGA